MRSEFLAFSPPLIGQDEIDEVIDTLRSDWITTGPKTKQFEEDFAAYLGAPGALALSSCTAGLHVALLALGVGPGDEVITSTFTFAATVNVIEHVGAHPVLVDIDPDTMNLSLDAVEAALTPKTRAVIPVHFAGFPVDIPALQEILARMDISIIEDAAHALPSNLRGRLVGSYEHFAAFSFYATKNLTTGEGGMLTGPQDLLKKARGFSLHGMNRDAWKRYGKGGSWFYEVTQPGFKYNMTDIQASLGIHQLKRLKQFHLRRESIASRYNAAFSSSPNLQLPADTEEIRHAWHLYTLRLREDSGLSRDRFLEELDKRNIGNSVHFIPIHMHPYYRDKYGYAESDFPVALNCFRRTFSIPMHPGLSEKDVEDVIEAVLDILDHNQ
jgi:dTDP-4-amino-4,6-dideoxygalactose transaminase